MTNNQNDRGSIPLALLAVIVLLGVTGALVSTVIGGTRQARFDREYSVAIQAADAGAQEGAQYIIRSLTSAQQEAPIGSTFDRSGVYGGRGTLADVPYDWRAVRSADAWIVTGTGGDADELQRDVVQIVSGAQPASFFQFALFADDGLEFAGGNGAGSYASGGLWRMDGGVVASNGNVEIVGNGEVAEVHLYNTDRAPLPGRCTRKCPDFLTETYPQPIDFDLDFMDDERFCTSSPKDGDGLFPDTTLGATVGTAGRADITRFCVNDLSIVQNLTVLSPVEFYVYGSAFVGPRLSVNCPTGGCPSSNGNFSLPANGSVQPNSQNLKIFVADSGDLDNPSKFAMSNQTDFAGVVYAPTSSCERDRGTGGGNSVAQTTVYGSMICNTVKNQGGWNFYYDERLGELDLEGLEEPFALRAWYEE